LKERSLVASVASAARMKRSAIRACSLTSRTRKAAIRAIHRANSANSHAGFQRARLFALPRDRGTEWAASEALIRSPSQSWQLKASVHPLRHSERTVPIFIDRGAPPTPSHAMMVARYPAARSRSTTIARDASGGSLGLDTRLPNGPQRYASLLRRAVIEDAPGSYVRVRAVA
jgi:hypothetical protein